MHFASHFCATSVNDLLPPSIISLSPAFEMHLDNDQFKESGRRANTFQFLLQLRLCIRIFIFSTHSAAIIASCAPHMRREKSFILCSRVKKNGVCVRAHDIAFAMHIQLKNEYNSIPIHNVPSQWIYNACGCIHYTAFNRLHLFSVRDRRVSCDDIMYVFPILFLLHI